VNVLPFSIRTLALASVLYATIATAETAAPARNEGGMLVGNNGMTLMSSTRTAQARAPAMAHVRPTGRP